MKKNIILLVAVFTSQLMFSQTFFDNLISNQGYNKSLTFDMNTSPSDVRKYRFISATGGVGTIGGTGSSSLLRFQSQVHNNWTTSMTFNSNRVGIGTDFPQEIFDVNGTARVEKLVIDPPAGEGRYLQIGQDVGSDLRIFNFGTSGNYAGASAYDTSGQSRYDYYHNTGITSLGIKDDAGLEIFKVSKSTIGSFIHLPQAQSRLVISDFGGYRINEGHKLVIKNGDALVEGDIIAEGDLNAQGDITADSNINAEGNLFVDGNVGIGTSNASERLTVNGKILAEEVKVIVNVPADYVFESYYNGTSELKDDYKMPTLKEVEAYTMKHKHLPEVPSAQQIKEEGMDVGEMTNMLLQKIEELTLYTIEQEKRIRQLEELIYKG